MSAPVNPDAEACRAVRVSFRPAVAADLSGIRALAERSANAAHWSTMSWERIFAAGISSRLVLLAEQHGGQATLAFVVAACSGPDWEIENIVVADAARRHGIAARLVVEVLDRARAAGAESVFLEVRGSNRAARVLYEKLGFTAAGRRPAYYSEPVEDAVIYRFGLLGSPAG